MEISELSKHSGIPISTIKYYLRAGLLPKPVKTGKTKAYYSKEYLNRLKLIKKLQIEENMSLKKISGIIEMVDDWKGPGPIPDKSGSNNFKTFLIESAITLFRKKGYDNTTIADIVDTLKIGRGTFYKYFKNKKELFIECVKNVIVSEAKAVGATQITSEYKNNLLALFDNYSHAYFREYPLWRDMIHMLRVAAMNDPDKFTDQLNEAVELKVNLFDKGIQKFIRKGLFKGINSMVLAVMLLGIQEYCNEYFARATPDVQEKVRNDINEILLHGLLKK